MREMIRRVLVRSAWGRSRLDARRYRRSLAFHDELVEAGSLCFDVGANVGDRTRLLADVGARVVAIEPQSRCVAELERRFGGHPLVTIEPVAVGSESGAAEIAICDQDPLISTMSEQWQREGRFADRQWSRTETVTMTTLDQLIATHGEPAFCKIDVEGFERQVLEGLSSPVPCLSFEFTQEFLAEARACVALLSEIGPIIVNASLGESMEFMGQWTDPEALFAELESLEQKDLWGDIYVRSDTPRH